PVAEISLPPVGPVVVAGGGGGDVRERPERRRVAVLEPVGVALRVDVTEIEEDVGPASSYESCDRLSARPPVGAVASRPDDCDAGRPVGHERVRGVAAAADEKRDQGRDGCLPRTHHRRRSRYATSAWTSVPTGCFPSPWSRSTLKREPVAISSFAATT